MYRQEDRQAEMDERYNQSLQMQQEKLQTANDRFDMAKDLAESTRITTAMMDKLNEHKADPARYEAFKNSVILGNPTVRTAMEKVYTPEGLTALLDSSTMETPEEKFKIKTSQDIRATLAKNDAELQQSADPVRIKMKEGIKDLELQSENARKLAPSNVQAATQLKINDALAAKEAEMAGEKSTSGQWIAQNKIEKERVAEVPNFQGIYDTVVPEAVALLGQDPDSTVTQLEKVTAGKAGQGINNLKYNPENLNVSYFKARLAPVGTKFPHPVTGQHMDEDSYKKLESKYLEALMTDSMMENGKRVPLSDAKRAGIINVLRENPILGGKASPLVLSAMPFAFNEAVTKTNPRLREIQNQLKTKFGYKAIAKPIQTPVKK
jgi:hypothetical protein